MRDLSTLLGLATIGTLSWATPALAEVEPVRVPRVSVHVDTVPYIFQGYSYWVGLEPAPHFNIQLAQFSMDVPPFAESPGWNLHDRAANLINIQYYMNSDNSGLFGAFALGQLQTQYSRPDTPNVTTEADAVFVIPSIGFRWFPLGGLYISPSLGIGYPAVKFGTPIIGNQAYQDPAPFAVFPALAIGYAFGR